MLSLTAFLTNLTKDLGYNPYTSFKTASGQIIDFVAVNSFTERELRKTVNYHILKGVREAGLQNFYTILKPFAVADEQIVGLMIEIYRRTAHLSSTFNVNRFYFSSGQWIDFQGWSDLNDGLNQVRSCHPWLNAYTPITGGTPLNYMSMSDQHLLNAWFQRMYDLMNSDATWHPQIDINLNLLRQDSPELDGILLATG
mgnify:CR=1 FL=1